MTTCIYRDKERWPEGVTLEGATNFSNVGWSQILELANKNGWEPERKNECRYTTNDSLRVSKTDAKHIADALERALPSIPDIRIPNISMDSPPEDFLSGTESKEKLRQTILYLRVGAFRIG